MLRYPSRMPETPSPVVAAQEWLAAHEAELIADTQRMLRIGSVQSDPVPNGPFGKENREALDLALKLANEWGMETKDVEGYAGHAEFGSGETMVMALGHLDVVPIGDGWKHEPFGAEIDGDYLYARGASDDKGPTMAAFYAARALKETGAEMPSRIRVVFGCNEESGFKCVERYFQTEEKPTLGFAPDAGWPCIYAEKGIADFVIQVSLPKGPVSLLSIEGGSRPNIVPDSSTAVYELSNEYLAVAKEKATEFWDKNITISWNANKVTVNAKGKAAHGSWPFVGDSAVERALRFGFEIAPSEQHEAFWKFVNLAHPSGVGLGIHGRDGVSKDLTANLGVAKTVSGLAEFTVNVRYPVTWQGEDLRKMGEDFLKTEWKEAKVASFSDSKPLYFPKDTEPVVSILKVVEAELGEKMEPGVMGGGTYARAVPNCVAIGTGWEGDGPAHEHDERMKVSHLLKMSKIYAHLFYKLAHAAAKK